MGLRKRYLPWLACVAMGGIGIPASLRRRVTWIECRAAPGRDQRRRLRVREPGHRREHGHDQRRRDRHLQLPDGRELPQRRLRRPPPTSCTQTAGAIRRRCRRCRRSRSAGLGGHLPVQHAGHVRLRLPGAQLHGGRGGRAGGRGRRRRATATATADAPTADGDGHRDGDADGDGHCDADADGDGDCDGDADGDGHCDGDADGDGHCDGDADGRRPLRRRRRRRRHATPTATATATPTATRRTRDADGDRDGHRDADAHGDRDRDADGDRDRHGTPTADGHGDPDATATADPARRLDGHRHADRLRQPTLALDLAPTANLGAFIPGVGKDYETSVAAMVTSSAGDATLAVADPSPTATGRLINGTFSLAQPVMARRQPGRVRPGHRAPTPLTLLTYAGPVSANAVTIGLKQTIGASESLRTGTYSKTLTFTLSTTTP